jgi:AmmeMemoRadiSam system protein A
MANSAATTGDVTRTVGYGAWSVMPALGECLDEAQRQRLLKLARQVLTSRVNRGKSPYIDTGTFPSWMQTHAACFVTLEQKGRLRGCIGSLRAHRPLVEDVAINVQKAAFEDRRFRPLRAEELEHTTLKIALLSPTHPMSFADQADLESQLVPHRDGLILRDAGHAGTFLPMVWDKLTGPHEFVQALKQKAGLPPEHWSDTLTVDLFHAETFAEG